MSETEDYDKSATPLAHKATHQDGGSDEISVTALSGLLANGQTPLAHKTSHQDGGSDEISVQGLWGLLPDGQNPLAHKTSHQLGGSDALSVAGLSGLLADGQTPLGHKTSHQAEGSDIIDADTLDTYHASAFALAGHNHNGVYSLINHNHAGVYEPLITPDTTLQYWRGDKTWQALNQAAVSGLTTIDKPTFAGIILTNEFQANPTSGGAFFYFTPGGPFSTPYLSWLNPSSLRLAYLGYSVTNMHLGLENGANFVVAGGNVGIGKSPLEPLDVAGKIRTDVTLNTGAKTPGHYFTMNINGTDVNVLCE